MRFDDYKEEWAKYFRMYSVSNHADYTEWKNYMDNRENFDSNSALAPFRQYFYSKTLLNGNTRSENLALLMKVMEKQAKILMKDMLSQEDPVPDFMKWNRELMLEVN